MILSGDEKDIIQSILESPSDSFVELAALAGLELGADFIAADLAGVDFGVCDLSAANFSRAYLVGADLSRANGVTVSMLAGAVFDTTTKFPEDIEEYLNEHAESAAFWKAGTPPSFVSGFGVDEFGQWLEFSIPGPGGKVTQRMRWIAAGTFSMGSPDSESERFDDEGPQHEVTISKGFWLFDAACPQRLWQAVMGGGNPSQFKGEDRPVERVSWHHVQEFLRRIDGLAPGLQLELPSEAQWEYACRAGTSTPFSFGENIMPAQVNYDGNFPYASAAKGLYRMETVSVRSLPPNPWGLHEMHGNVWEWCADGRREYQERGAVNPLVSMKRENARLRVLRGGSWGSYARNVRSSNRSANAPEVRSGDIGFRCARVQDGAEPAEKRRVQRSGAARTAAFSSGGTERARWREGGDGVRIFPRAETFVIHSDREWATAEPITCPPWAAAIGRDSYGLWTRIVIPGPCGLVEQRLRWINPGRFLMGSPEDEIDRSRSEGPSREVMIAAGFWLFETACSQALWTAVMGKNRSRFRGVDHPVENVSWRDVKAFIAAINRKIKGLQLSLPSEAQWEYACRAGTVTPFSFGESITPEQVNYVGRASALKGWNRMETVPVGSLAPNPWGLYEMHGNVYEWCADPWHENYEGAPTDGSIWEREGETARRVLRGGSWHNNAQSVRSAFRSASAPVARSSDIGFRCARVED